MMRVQGKIKATNKSVTLQAKPILTSFRFEMSKFMLFITKAVLYVEEQAQLRQMLINVLVMVIFCGYSKGWQIATKRSTAIKNKLLRDAAEKHCQKYKIECTESSSKVPTHLNQPGGLYGHHKSNKHISHSQRENDQVGWSVKLLEVRDGDDHQQIHKHSPCWQQ